MFHIFDKKTQSYLVFEEKTGINQRLNEKTLRVNDTPLSYRQINYLDSKGVLPDNRKNKRGWHSLSFKDVVFINVVFELRKFGILDRQLKDLAYSFYKAPINSNVPNKLFSDHAVTLALLDYQIYIFVNSNGAVGFCDLPNINELFKQSNALHINFTETVNKVLHKIIDRKENTYYSFLNLANKDFDTADISEKEKKILLILRNKICKEMTIKKKHSGELSVAVVKTEVVGSDLPIEQGVGDFSDIKTKRRDGKIVGYSIENTVRL